MPVDSLREHDNIRQWENADEIDLTRYFAALARRWREILLVMLAVIVATATAVLIYRAITPPVYEATATAAIVRISTDVRFDERYTTSSAQPNLDVNSRRTALIALVHNGAIAQQVIAELGDALPSSLQNPADLLEVVEGEMATANGGGQSDLINITVRTESPETSAAVANAWAKAYVQHVNSIYGQTPDEMLISVETQLAAAQQTYQEAQTTLENHLSTSRLNELVRQSDTVSQTLNVLQATQLDAITGENDRNRSQLRMDYDQWLRTNSLLAAARTLGEQANSEAAATDVAGVALALQVLQVQMVNAAAVSPPALNNRNFSPAQQAPTTLQLQLDSAAMSLLQLRTQISATVESLETQLVLLESNIQQTTRTLALGAQQVRGELPAETIGVAVDGESLTGTIAQLEQQLRNLQGQVEVEAARTLEFTEQRDLAWESVQALSNKQAELQLARAAANSEVRLSSTAVPLDQPVDRISLALSLALAGFVGLLLGIFLAVSLEAAGVPPLRARRGVVNTPDA